MVVGSNPTGRADKQGVSVDDDLQGGPYTGPGSQDDVVEAALANAISEAVAAGKFDVVGQLCRELEARRLARAGNVVAIDSKRRGGAK